MKCKSLLLISLIALYLLLGACLFALLENEPRAPPSSVPGPLLRHAQLLGQIAEDFPEANQTLLLAALGISPPKAAESQVIAEALTGGLPSDNASYTVVPSGMDKQKQPEGSKLPYGIRMVYWFTYCVSLLTTVGYGDVYPKTAAGKALTILYGSIGIPLVFFCIFKLGLMFKRTTRGLMSKGARRWGALESFFRRRGYFPVELPIHIVLYIICMVLIPSAIFCSVEKWSYGDSIYFSFVSLTTVGFGDLLHNQDHLGFALKKVLLYKILSKAWIFSGLVWQACVISIVWNKLLDFPAFRGFVGPSRPAKSIAGDFPLTDIQTSTLHHNVGEEAPSVGEEERLNTSLDPAIEKMKPEC